MEVLTFLTTLSMLFYSVLRIVRFFVPREEPQALLPPPQKRLVHTDHMIEVEFKGLDYGPPTRYFVQGQNGNKVWLLAQTNGGLQHSLVVNQEALRSPRRNL